MGVPPEGGAEQEDSGVQPQELTAEAKLTAMLEVRLRFPARLPVSVLSRREGVRLSHSSLGLL